MASMPSVACTARARVSRIGASRPPRRSSSSLPGLPAADRVVQRLESRSVVVLERRALRLADARQEAVIGPETAQLDEEITRHLVRLQFLGLGDRLDRFPQLCLHGFCIGQVDTVCLEQLAVRHDYAHQERAVARAIEIHLANQRIATRERRFKLRDRDELALRKLLTLLRRST